MAMLALKGELLLAAWEAGLDKHPLDRGLLLLSIALPECDHRQLAELTIAERNLLLLQLREATFGKTLQGFGTCSRCHAHLEFAAPVATIIEHLRTHFIKEPIVWSEDGRQYRLRPVTTNDLLAATDAPSDTEAKDLLLKRCLCLTQESSESQTQALSDELLQAALPAGIPHLVEKFDELNASAELACAVRCPDCSNSEMLDLDVAQFVWIEVRSAAKRLLVEIHELAWAYGWSENEILRLTPQRRDAYIEILSS